MVGLFIPVGIIFIVELLKYKIENRSDVELLTNVPILGELPLCGHKSSDKGMIVVRENKNDMMEETFRDCEPIYFYATERAKSHIVLLHTARRG